MAQFEPMAPNVEVNGETVLTTINAFPEYMRALAIDILKKQGIENPVAGEWYSQEGWLNSFREISEKYGSNTLFEIGKKIPENAQFPPEIDSIEKGLAAIDVAYNMNHRNGEIGFYKMVEHNPASKTIKMQCKNPYPCDFDRGILITMARKFKLGVSVELDESWYTVKY